MLKDETLDRLAEQGANIAQFVSYDPSFRKRFCRLNKKPDDTDTIEQVISCFLNQLEFPSLNIRTFLPDKPEGNPFDYGLMDSSMIAAKVKYYLEKGYYVIVNQTIRVNDGGFSGVLLGSLLEGAPNETPRCVEKPGCMRLPKDLAFNLIRKIYGYHFHMPFNMNHRVEFSVHPSRVGYAGDFIVIWQADEYDKGVFPDIPRIQWPNKYSSAMGDKAFGLLIADLLGFPVPRTIVFGRIIPQFQLGTPIGNNEPVWVRTAPKEQTPGKFKTARGWMDPFKIMQEDDPDNTKIAAILIQDGIKAEYSGSVITDSCGGMILEGCRGYGDKFMTGVYSPDSLPKKVLGEVIFLYQQIKEKLGEMRFEWVYDGEKAWLVQLHVGGSASAGNVIYPGEAVLWIDFDVKDGLEKLREMVEMMRSGNKGIVLHGDIGITSHMGDILRKAKIPSRLIKH